MLLTALIIFILMYVVMIGFPRYRVWAVLAAAGLFLAAGIMPLYLVPGSINWNVLLMMSGTMLTVDYFIRSKMPNRIAEVLLVHSKNVMWVTIYMSLFSGAISAFIDNVATVLMVAPVALAVCRKLKISPVPMVLSIAVSSNLQGAATLVGDTTSIMLGAYAKMDFLDFFWMDGRPGIFFAVELGALATVPIMMLLFRKETEPVTAEGKTQVEDVVPSVMLVLMVLLLIAASFFKNKPEITNGLICVILALITAASDYIRTRKKHHLRRALFGIDIETLLMLTGMFIVISGVTNVGVIEIFGTAILRIGRGNVFVLYSIIVWGSVFMSAFVDNIPYVATMLPVVSVVTASLRLSPCLMYFGLLCGATLGGNLTPVGASANIAAVGMLQQHGYEIDSWDFMRIGVPFTLAAVLAGYVFLWIVWR